MAVEFFIKFHDANWYRQNKKKFEEMLINLPTYVKHRDGEFWLRGAERDGDPGSWGYDVRVFTDNESDVFLEISARPKSIEHDLLELFANLRNETEIAIVDEDGERSNW